MTLIDIIKNFKNGDKRSAKDLYLHSYKWLFATALRYAPDESTAKDALQNTYIKIYSNIESIHLESEAMVAGWMKKICINEALVLIRKKKNWDKLQVNSNSEAFIPQYEFENQELYTLLHKLPAQQRICFNLFAIEGYSHKEISEQLDIKESYSRTLVARARKELSVILPKVKIHEAL